MLIRLSPAIAALALAATAGAATISGTIFDDPRAYAVRSEFRPLGGANVMLYRDGGDRRPDGADDRLVTSVRAAENGAYSFGTVADGLYWIAVDSRTIGNHEATWPEQTYGPAGAICDNGVGSTTVLGVPGACYGGRFAAQSDDARQLATAKHVAGVTVAGTDVHNADFGFSDNVVTNVKDGANVQGSLRQFITNANAIPGPNAMRFVPVGDVQAGEQWIIRLTSPLPPLRQAGTTIDGTLYSFLTGHVVGTAGYDLETRAGGSRQPRPRIHLQIIATGENGLSFEAPGDVKVVEIHDGRTAIRTTADLSIERSIIAGAGENGLVATAGTVTVRNVAISDRSQHGVAVEGNTLLDMSDTEITRCGNTSGSAVALHVSAALLTRCTITNNVGIGIEVDGRGNAIRSSQIVDNAVGIVLRPRATNSNIEYDDIVWNHGGAIVGEAVGAPAKHNRIATNHFNENGGAVIGIGAPEEETATTTCEPDTLGTTGTPRVDSTSTTGTEGNGLIAVDGVACPNTTIEVYTSYVTSELRKHIQENAQDLSSVREALKRNEVESRDDTGLTRLRLPSVGEFNFAGSAIADASGHFHAVVPWPRQLSHNEDNRIDLRGGALSVAAVAIDRDGNTSHFSRRKLVNSH
ncbi:MAG TPA: right-handed parallel beta-helix repeat-containing protein [Thermoanaerobaculia bacterium]